MKKTGKIILSILLLLTIVGCSSENNRETEEAAAYPERDVDYPSVLEELGEDAIAIHYQREDNRYDKWTLWLWDPEGTDDNKEDDFNYQDDYGVIAYYPLSHFGDGMSRLGIIVKNKGTWSVKDATDSDRFIVFSEYQKDENGVYHVYLAGDDAHIYKSADKVISDAINSVSFVNENNIYVSCSNPVESYTLYADGVEIQSGSGAGRSKFSERLSESADFSKSYLIEVVFRGSNEKLSAAVPVSGLYGTEAFDTLYYYDGELGALYSPEKTVFKVWSPASSEITLRIYENGTPKSVSASRGDDTYTEYVMEKGEKGVFSYTLSDDQEGKYYTYFVKNQKYPDGAETIDPYAKAAGVNGKRGMIVDFSKTDPEGWKDVRYLGYDRKELTVYETHVADVTSSDTWTGSSENKRRYLGLVEEGTTYSEGDITVSTGFDHIQELGVNAIQLQPVFDQDNDETSYTFNWGYNPLNYNVVEGIYSSDPYDGYVRIKEFKTMLMKLNEAGISVIMDVVYNHVSFTEKSSFDILMPEYYYRYNSDGSLSNGSGCGNETASERSMMRKFIIDSICFWCEEYKLGGFRFDLMGLHDIETMNLAVEALRKINPDVVVYGEPWTGGGTTLEADRQAKQSNANLFEGYGQFNDQMRDALIKGGLNGPKEKGWVSGTDNLAADLSAIQNGINGITYNMAYVIADPNKTVNYVTCHDNYTLYDRIKAAGIEDEDTVRKMCVLANSVVFTSNGTAFMLAGEEFLRTKQGDSNSYMSSDDINALDYSLKIKNMDVFEVYQKLIAFKQNIAQLQLDDSGINVELLENGSVLKYEVSSERNTYLILHANGTLKQMDVDLSGYDVYLDTLQSSNNGVLQPYQTLILKEK